MFSSFSSYRYLPLKPASRPDGEFRILTLLPGPKGSKLEATLEHVSFASHPPYEALSYTWGNPKGPRSLIPVKGNPEETFEIKIKGMRKHSIRFATRPDRSRSGLILSALIKKTNRNGASR